MCWSEVASAFGPARNWVYRVLACAVAHSLEHRDPDDVTVETTAERTPRLWAIAGGWYEVVDNIYGVSAA